MTAYDVKGDAIRDGDIVTGWCWSPERGHQRLRVSLYLDDALICSTVAARLRADLVRDGVCDGYHGFSLPLPSPMPAYSVLELREIGTGTAFARLLNAEMEDTRRWSAMTEALAEAVADARDSFIEPGCAGTPSAALAAQFGVIGGMLARDAAAGRLDCITLPEVSQPRISVILPLADDTQDAVADRVIAFAPLLAGAAAELIVVDEGAVAIGPALMRLRGLIYRRGGGTLSGCINLAARWARAPLLIVLDPGMWPGGWSIGWPGGGPVGGPVNDAARCLGVARDGADILIGGRAALAARAAGLDGAFACGPRLLASDAVLLVAPRDLFTALDGLDPMMEDYAALPVLDFGLKARAAAVAVAISPPEHIRFVTAVAARAGDRPGEGAVRARAQFAARWRGAAIAPAGR